MVLASAGSSKPMSNNYLDCSYFLVRNSALKLYLQSVHQENNGGSHETAQIEGSVHTSRKA